MSTRVHTYMVPSNVFGGKVVELTVCCSFTAVRALPFPRFPPTLCWLGCCLFSLEPGRWV